MAKIGNWHITDTEIFFLARKIKHDQSKFELGNYNMVTNTQTLYSTTDGFLEFENINIYGYLMNQYPIIDALIGIISEEVSLSK
mmetsp:Transcript_17438/g.19593  ORF Transcript_17438/g.19593 Transcript_17438/m.19593 type:complete len:84 (-) Transcript_17438:23-274(-)